jgi:hypothetical protein
MRIYSLSKIIGLPIILMIIAALYVEYVVHYSLGYWVLLPFFLGVVLLISNRYIDFWYLRKFPIRLDKEVTDLLERYIPFYNNLDATEKGEYQIRLSKYISGRSFKSVGSEMKDVPYDIRAMISTNAIQLAFHQKDFLIGDFDHIYVYKHPFGTPKHQFLHTVETEAEDGVIIYSLEQLVPGITNPELYYNIGMHGFVDAFIKANPTAPFPPRLNADWSDIHAISGLSQKQILATIGFENVELLVVLGTCYFTYAEAFEKRLPSLKKELDILFNVSII